MGKDKEKRKRDRKLDRKAGTPEPGSGRLRRGEGARRGPTTVSSKKEQTEEVKHRSGARTRSKYRRK